MTQINQQRKYHSFRDAIKLLVGILTALAVKNAVSQLAEGGGTVNVRPLTEVPISVWLTFFTSITFTLRFFFGNIEYLNSDPDDDTIELLLDTSVVLVQSMLLALITNYINRPDLFFFYVICLLLVECAWYLIFSIQAHIRKKTKLESPIGYGLASSIVTIILLISIGYTYPASLDKLTFVDIKNSIHLNLPTISIIIFANLCFDIWINGKRYLDIQGNVIPIITPRDSQNESENS